LWPIPGRGSSSRERELLVWRREKTSASGTGADSIEFKIHVNQTVAGKSIAGDNWWRIVLEGYLPVISDALDIDGTTAQDLNSLGPDILLYGGNITGWAAGGLRIAASTCTVQGLTVNTFTNTAGIAIYHNTSERYVPPVENIVIKDNFIGVDMAGQQLPSGANVDGITVIGRSGWVRDVQIATNLADNVVSGTDQEGVLLRYSDDLHLTGNYIGTDKTGDNVVSIGWQCLKAEKCKLLWVGGDRSKGEGNVLAGSPYPPLTLSDCHFLWIAGNNVNIDASGKDSLAVSGAAMLLKNCTRALVGGYLQQGKLGALGNIFVSGGAGAAVSIAHGSSFAMDTAVLMGNYIGIDAAATNDLSLGGSFSIAASGVKVAGVDLHHDSAMVVDLSGREYQRR